MCKRRFSVHFLLHNPLVHFLYSNGSQCASVTCYDSYKDQLYLTNVRIIFFVCFVFLFFVFFFFFDLNMWILQEPLLLMPSKEELDEFVKGSLEAEEAGLDDENFSHIVLLDTPRTSSRGCSLSQRTPSVMLTMVSEDSLGILPENPHCLCWSTST